MVYDSYIFMEKGYVLWGFRQQNFVSTSFLIIILNYQRSSLSVGLGIISKEIEEGIFVLDEGESGMDMLDYIILNLRCKSRRL